MQTKLLLSAENIFATSKQGPIYVRACQPLKDWVLSGLFESDDQEMNEMEGGSQPSRPKRLRQSTIDLTGHPNEHKPETSYARAELVFDKSEVSGTNENV